MGRSGWAIRLRLYQSSPFLLPTHHMTQLKCESTMGNFNFKAATEVSDEVLVILANMGLLQVLQRSPVTTAEKRMAGYEKRPKDFKRASIDFNEVNAAILAEELGKAVAYGEPAKEGDKAPEFPLTIVTEVIQHFPGEGAEPAFAEEKKFLTFWLDRSGEGFKKHGGKLSDGRERTVETFCELRGFDVPETEWSDDKEFLAKVREWKREEDKKKE